MSDRLLAVAVFSPRFASAAHELLDVPRKFLVALRRISPMGVAYAAKVERHVVSRLGQEHHLLAKDTGQTAQNNLRIFASQFRPITAAELIFFQLSRIILSSTRITRQ